MNFVIAYAGIPSVVFDDVWRREAHICGDNCHSISRPLRAKGSSHSYSLSDTNFYLKEFAGRLKEDHHGEMRDVGLAMICVGYPQDTTERFVKSFFPSVLTVSIPWFLNSTSAHTIRTSKNELVELLKATTDDVKKTIPVVKKELQERDSVTPLLLPVKNFSSKTLKESLLALQNSLVRSPEKSSEISNAIHAIVSAHPRQKIGSARRACFVDDKKVEFHPPGSARHAFARGSGDHPDSCFLSGRRRLGAPYDHAFHYDCKRGGGNLRGEFWGCHHESSITEGHPHLNIAPNDFVR